MNETTLIAPLTTFARHPGSAPSFAARVVKAMAAPVDWWAERQAAAEVAQLSEREWSDIGAGARDLGHDYAGVDLGEDRAARKLALHAWFGAQGLRPTPRATLA